MSTRETRVELAEMKNQADLGLLAILRARVIRKTRGQLAKQGAVSKRKSGTLMDLDEDGISFGRKESEKLDTLNKETSTSDGIQEATHTAGDTGTSSSGGDTEISHTDPPGNEGAGTQVKEKKLVQYRRQTRTRRSGPAAILSDVSTVKSPIGLEPQARQGGAYKVSLLNYLEPGRRGTPIFNKSQHLRRTSSTISRQRIGILSWSEDRWKWLQTVLCEMGPNSELREFRHIGISKAEKKKVTKEISECSFSILHVTKNHIKDLEDISPRKLKIVLVVFDGQGKNRSEMDRIRDRLSRLGVKHVISISKEEKSDYQKFQPDNYKKALERIQGQLSKLEKLVSETVNDDENTGMEDLPICDMEQKSSSPYSIGIFSRSAESDYKWLKILLQSEGFRDQGTGVQSFHISNNGLLQFIEDVSLCKIGILYHTKNRGGINVTDVTDSLYDEELKLMSGLLGWDNVYVVIDDLEDSSPNEKKKILDNQPSIKKYAYDTSDASSPEELIASPLEEGRIRAHHVRAPEERGTDRWRFTTLASLTLSACLAWKDSDYSAQRVLCEINSMQEDPETGIGATPGSAEDAWKSYNERNKPVQPHGLKSEESPAGVPQVSVSGSPTEPPENERTGYTESKVKICYWDPNTDISWLENHLTSSSSMRIRMDNVKENEWNDIIDTSHTIICYYEDLTRTWGHMSKFQKQCIARKGRQSVAVVVGENENELKKKKTQWMENLAGCRLFLFTKNEVAFLDPNTRRMEDTLNNMMEILKEESQPQSDLTASRWTLGNSTVKHSIGIISRQKDEFNWLKTSLNGKDKDGLFQFKHTEIPRGSEDKIKKKITEKISKYSYTIFLVSEKHVNDLKYIPAGNPRIKTGKKEVFAVIYDSENNGTDDIITRIKTGRTGINHVLQYSKNEKESYQRFRGQRTSEKAGERIRVQLSELKTLVSDTDSSNRVTQNTSSCNTLELAKKEQWRSLTHSQAKKGQKTPSSWTLGIFSRSAESDYEWLQTLLQSEGFRGQAPHVRSFYISNNGMAQFMEDVSECKFGILYHTKNRGGINITDVMDSLYDEELKLMSDNLGKDNVLVVIDDLEDSSPQERNRILHNQPSIRIYSSDLFLIAETRIEYEKIIKEQSEMTSL
ncbi:Hypothetical predicted protein [Pelobates cultripes]|uniref:Uncharacterized protein n=1 Tax=Pelobates cultripes TaxID=61616 RepID=A0AAD1WJA4_PELCU|nr:Hypothetical predicted protein [Pelobates cultripes]